MKLEKLLNEFIQFIKKYGLLVFIEFVVVLVYIYCPTSGIGNNFSIILSPEILATILVGIAAVYSWFSNKSDKEYENNLQMLKDIDEIYTYYRGKENLDNIVDECRSHMELIEKDPSYEEKFLMTYLRYIQTKFVIEETVSRKRREEDFSEDVQISTIGELDESDEVTVKNILKSQGYRNVRYSKNYDIAANKAGFKWTTWFCLTESYIEKFSADDELVFLTEVDGKFTGVAIDGNSLNLLSKKMKPRNSKNGNKQYDFYIAKKSDNTFIENRNGIPLKIKSK